MGRSWGSLCISRTKIALWPNDTYTIANYQAIAIDIPDGVSRQRLDPPQLPPDWNRIPGPESLKELGTAWAGARESALLVVPSAVIPFEYNYLVNPDHPDAARLVPLPALPFSFDSRLQP